MTNFSSNAAENAMLAWLVKFPQTRIASCGFGLGGRRCSLAVAPDRGVVCGSVCVSDPASASAHAMAMAMAMAWEGGGGVRCDAD